MMEHRDFLSITDLSIIEIEQIFSKAKEHKDSLPVQSLFGRTVVLVFEKASTRTRISFETGVARMGGHAIVLTPEGTQMARGEPLKDTARILSGYCDGIVLRTFGHNRVEEMAKFASVPVVNALTDLLHPCQVLSDCFTLGLRFGDLAGKKVAWIGDGNNMANSWINAAAVLGFEMALACPKGYDPDETIMNSALECGAKVNVTRDPAEAVTGAIAVNTDVWASMGQEDEADGRKKEFSAFGVTKKIMERAAEEAVFMHCLPAHREEEVTEEVLEGPQSIVWEQARNRLYVQEAIMDFLLRQ